MRKYLYVLLLLVAATALRPVPAFAVNCVMEDEGAGRVVNGVWQYPMRDSSPALERKELLRKVLCKPVDQTRAAVRYARFEGGRTVAHSQRMPVPEKAGLSIDGRMALDFELASDQSIIDVWLESANATPALFRPTKRGRYSGATDSVVVDVAARTRTEEKNGMPKPGGWAMLMAGVLCVCTVARRRMVSI